MKALGRRECPARTGEHKCNLRSRRRLLICRPVAADVPNPIYRFIRRPPNQGRLCINMWTNCGSLVRKREIYSQIFSGKTWFFIERTCRADTIFAARESVEASSLARSHPRSFGVAGGERGDESSGATRPFGAAPLGLEGAVSSERHLRAGGLAPGRPAPVSDRRRHLRAAGAVTGGRGTLRGLAVFGAKIRPQGRRDATRGTGCGRRAGFSPAISREGDTAPRPGGVLLNGSAAEGRESRKPGRSLGPGGFGSRGVGSVRPDTSVGSHLRS